MSNRDDNKNPQNPVKSRFAVNQQAYRKRLAERRDNVISLILTMEKAASELLTSAQKLKEEMLPKRGKEK